MSTILAQIACFLQSTHYPQIAASAFLSPSSWFDIGRPIGKLDGTRKPPQNCLVSRIRFIARPRCD
jgi:hypothetical protein